MTDDQDRIRPAFAEADWLRKKEIFLLRELPAPLSDLLRRRTDFPQVLDCGTGIGSLIKYLASTEGGREPLIQYERIVGVDKSDALLRHHAPGELAHVKDVLLLCGDVTNLRALHDIAAHGDAGAVSQGFDDETFDLVMSLELLEHVPLPVSALQEMWRVLKPGGTLLCLRNADAEIILEPAHELDSKVISNFYKYVFGPQSDHRCGRKLWEYAAAAGLSGTVITSTPWLIYPPLTPDEQLTILHIVDEFFYPGSTTARVPKDSWETDGIPGANLEAWRRERIDQLDRGKLVFYVNSLSLTATKPA